MRAVGEGNVRAAGEDVPLVDRLRTVHLQMVEAVLSGDGLEEVAALAAGEAGAAGGSVVISIPRLEGRPTAAAVVPAGATMDVPVTTGGEVIGHVYLLGPARTSDAREFLSLAAVAALTEVAIAETRQDVEENLRGSLLEELRSGVEIDPAVLVRRAGRLGCDLTHGAVALCAEPTGDRPRHLVALITSDHPGALVQILEGRIYALLPGGEGVDALVPRLERHGAVGVSTFCSSPAGLPRALQEAELVLDVRRRSGISSTQDVGRGAYRLLMRVLASRPEELRAFHEDTVAPLVRYDDQYRTDLLGTLEAYLEHDCNMNATAAAIFAHRHTVAYRLDRVKELTGLDPSRSEHRERLGLGLKAHRLLEPGLPG